MSEDDLPPDLEKALREIFAWGSHYPLRQEDMHDLASRGLVRRMLGLTWLGMDYWDITKKGRAWVRSRQMDDAVPDWGEPTWTCSKCDAMGFPPMFPTNCQEKDCPMDDTVLRDSK